jgi:pimeloyl-ACP methyl ester carboxylesterase
VLNRQPQFVPGDTQFDTAGTEVSAFSTPGIASVNLRGLGSNRNLVLMPGLLFPTRMHEPLATALADRGNRVITLDLLGHGESDQPRSRAS